jgi:hypothetical protein
MQTYSLHMKYSYRRKCSWNHKHKSWIEMLALEAEIAVIQLVMHKQY